MTGTILAVLAISWVLVVALGVALLSANRTKEQQEAPRKRKGRAAEFVTYDELEEILDKYSKQFEFENTEWYDKFNALHQRLAKREKRGKPPELEPLADEEEPQLQLHSALPFRKLGSL